MTTSTDTCPGINEQGPYLRDSSPLSEDDYKIAYPSEISEALTSVAGGPRIVSSEQTNIAGGSGGGSMGAPDGADAVGNLVNEPVSLQNVTLNSFTVGDEQEFSQDEVYAILRSDLYSYPIYSETYANLDSDDTIYLGLSINFRRSASIAIIEQDGETDTIQSPIGEFIGDNLTNDDLIGEFSIRDIKSPHTVQGSGGEYTVAFTLDNADILLV